jgi:hypothetical protein
MSVPSSKLMDMIKSQRGGNGPGPTISPDTETPEMGAPSTGDAPPMAAPMSTPEAKMGNIEAAKINISMAMDLIEQAFVYAIVEMHMQDFCFFKLIYRLFIDATMR